MGFFRRGKAEEEEEAALQKETEIRRMQENTAEVQDQVRRMMQNLQKR
ncbi:MAG: hypothetical protein HY558_08390 [Euryarchaeota archaeon]|nr:hypothetical protein [Euryarchaeota archaeon]